MGESHLRDEVTGVAHEVDDSGGGPEGAVRGRATEVVDKGPVHKRGVVAWRGPAEDVRDPGLVAYVEDGRNALKDLLGFSEHERIRRGERVCRYAVGIGSGVEGHWAAWPVVEMADDAVGLAGRVHHDRAELVVGDVAKERGEDSVVGDVGVEAGSLVEADAVESVEVEMGRKVLGVGVAGDGEEV